MEWVDWPGKSPSWLLQAQVVCQPPGCPGSLLGARRVSYLLTSGQDSLPKAVKEIKDLYDFTGIQKFLLFVTLVITFLAGSLSYGLDVGADYRLLYKSYDCLFNNSTIKSMKNNPFNHSSNTTSNFILYKIYNCSFINSTTPSMNDNQFNHSTNSTSTWSTSILTKHAISILKQIWNLVSKWFIDVIIRIVLRWWV